MKLFCQIWQALVYIGTNGTERSFEATERYLGCEQKLQQAVNDRLGIEPRWGPLTAIEGWLANQSLLGDCSILKTANYGMITKRERS